MKNIVIYGNKKDFQISNALIRILSQKHSINFISASNFFTIGTGDPINIIDFSTMHNISLSNCILILKQNTKMFSFKCVAKSTNVIVDASNEKTVSQLASFLPNVYTCGFSSKDCMTFSSKDESNVVVSLQRSVYLSKKIICEPFEIPCNINEDFNDYTILASILTLILIGELNENISKDLDKICFSY